MALNDIENKKLGFYTTVTNNPVDATMLPIIYKKTGNIIISYSEIDKEETPHMWLGGQHVASGYGQNKYKDKQNLSYISNSYNIVWNFITELDQYSPFYLNNEYRTAVLKDSNSESISNFTLIIGEESNICSHSENSTILGDNNKVKGTSTTVIGSFNKVRSKNSFVAGSYIETPESENQFIMGVYPSVSELTTFAFGNGVSRQNKSNVIEIAKNGDIFIKGIGLEDTQNALYSGTLINQQRYPQSFQSYISDSLSYNVKFAERYTNDQITNLIGGAPDALNSLKEIADFISDINQNNNIYIPVENYNKLSSDNTYYYCARDIELTNLNIDENPYKYIESKLREAWDANKRTYNEVYDYFKNYLHFSNTNLSKLWGFYRECGIFIEDSKTTHDNSYTYLVVEGINNEHHHGVPKDEVESLYNYLYRYEKVTEPITYIYDTHYNTGLIYYYKENNTSLISSVHQIQNSYIINNGSGKSNVGYTWIPCLGETTYLNTILDALLERPKYTRPELKIKDFTYIYEVGSNVTPSMRFDFEDTVRNPALVNYEAATTNENLGYSYSFYENNYLYGFGINIYSSLNGLNSLEGDIKTNYNFSNFTVEERDYEVITYIDYNYTYSTYMFYPQLLANKNSAKVVCHDGWFDNETRRYNNKHTIKGMYKYYYGWDNIPTVNDTNLSSKAKGEGWLNRSGSTQVQVPFSENHSIFWFAFPYRLYTQQNINNYFVLYKTSLGEQDLVSETAPYEKIMTTNTVSVCGERYSICIIDFKREYLGESSNYIKFNIKRI